MAVVAGAGKWDFGVWRMSGRVRRFFKRCAMQLVVAVTDSPNHDQNSPHEGHEQRRESAFGMIRRGRLGGDQSLSLSAADLGQENIANVVPVRDESKRLQRVTFRCRDIGRGTIQVGERKVHQ
jgi:hypothetical protein